MKVIKLINPRTGKERYAVKRFGFLRNAYWDFNWNMWNTSARTYFWADNTTTDKEQAYTVVYALKANRKPPVVSCDTRRNGWHG